MITRDQYENHDCHAGPEDYCEACGTWSEQCEEVEKQLQALGI